MRLPVFLNITILFGFTSLKAGFLRISFATPTFGLVLLLVPLLTACSSLPKTLAEKLPLSKKPTQASCANLDWFEIGRADGAMGARLEKNSEYHQRCDATPNPFDTDLYVNGRNAGLIEFCSSTQGFEAGRSGTPYDVVCPYHLEKNFLESYKIGAKVRELESENVDLQSRIDDLVRLLAPNQPGSSVRAKIDQLRELRVQNESEIDTLENRATATEQI